MTQSFLVDDISADLDVADELAVIDYASKKQKSNQRLEEQIISAKEE